MNNNVGLITDIVNKIYLYRANFTLKDICNEYFIDFKKLCLFLKKYNAIIHGSSIMHCFDTIIEYNDIDILVYYPKSNQKSNKSYQKMDIWMDFLSIYTIDKEIIKVKRTPIANPLFLKSPNDYHIQFINKHDKKIIDMLFFIEMPCDAINKYLFTSISNSFFDGTHFNIPFSDNIHKFVCNKKIKLIQPYNTLLAHYYDPWYYDTNLYIDNYFDRYHCMQLPTEIEHRYNKKLYAFLNPFYKQIKVNQENLIKMYQIITKDIYLNSLQDIFTNDFIKKEFNGCKFIQLKAFYEAWHRILKYIKNGYYITNLNDFVKLTDDDYSKSLDSVLDSYPHVSFIKLERESDYCGIYYEFLKICCNEDGFLIYDDNNNHYYIVDQYYPDCSGYYFNNKNTLKYIELSDYDYDKYEDTYFDDSYDNFGCYWNYHKQIFKGGKNLFY